MKTLRITLEGRTYDVAVEVLGENNAPAYVPAPAPVQVQAAPAPAAQAAPVQVAAPAPAPVAAPAATGGGSPVVSPMAGQVMKIKVAVGATVTVNQEVIVLEAMKMETPIYAPVAGTIKGISVKEGEAVSEGQLMLTIG